MGHMQWNNDQEKFLKMISDSKGKGFEAKQEIKENTNEGRLISRASTSSRQWSGFRNPRIVRISRALGGKDRHSKVCTIRGLRDRRIRLSVPTAIQLYDLQDRLGVSQPSKVIDWLLDVTKLDIDNLPPLQIPPGFTQFHQPMLLPPPHHDHLSAISQSSAPFLADQDQILIRKSTSKLHWDLDASMNAKSKQLFQRDQLTHVEKGKWIKKTDDQEDDGRNDNHGNRMGGDYGEQVNSIQKLFPSSGPVNNAMANYNYFHSSDPSSCLSLSQSNYGAFASQVDHPSPIPTSPFPLQSNIGSQLFFCPPASSTPTFFTPFPSYITSTTPLVESSSSSTTEPRPQFQNPMQFFGSTTSQHALPNSLIMPASLHSFKPFTAGNADLKQFFHCQNNVDHQSPGKD